MIHLHPSFQGGYSELARLLHSTSVPPYLQGAIQAHPDTGFQFTAIESRQVPAGISLDWWNFVMFASEQDEWVVTTGELEIRQPQSMSVIHPDVEANQVGVLDPSGGFVATIPAHAWGKTCPSEDWPLSASGGMRTVSRMRGSTGQPYGVIVVCNRARGDVPQGARPGSLVPEQIVHTFFHEVALHAGTISYHLSGHPGQAIDHPGVNALGRQLDQVIPPPVSGLRVILP